MTAFVLIPGAGGVGAYWTELVAELEARGHVGIAVDIREDDPALGLPEYAAITEAAFGEHTDVVLVAQSLGGFTVPTVANRKPVRMIVLVNAMVPLPGETPGDWWDATGSGEARRTADAAAGRGPDFDIETYFLHDIPANLKASMYADAREPSDTPFGQRCEFDQWPEVPIKVIVGRDDRFFPADFQRRVAKERLGADVDEIPGGHLVAKSHPAELADTLVGYLRSP